MSNPDTSGPSGLSALLEAIKEPRPNAPGFTWKAYDDAWTLLSDNHGEVVRKIGQLVLDMGAELQGKRVLDGWWNHPEGHDCNNCNLARRLAALDATLDVRP